MTGGEGRNKNGLELRQVQTRTKGNEGTDISVTRLQKNAHKTLRDCARPSATISHLTDISKENRDSKLPTRQPLPHPTHLHVSRYQKEAGKLLRDHCLFHVRINQLRFTKKGTQEMQVSPHAPASIPSCHLSVEAWRQFFTHSHALWKVIRSKHKPQLAFFHKEVFVKDFESCLCKSGAHFCREVPTGIWWKPFATLVPHRSDHQRFYTPKEIIKPIRSAGEYFLRNNSSTNFLWAWLPFAFVELF